MDKQKSKLDVKKLPEDQMNMKNSSEHSKLARNNLHFKESEATRVAGFRKSAARKRQVKKDAQT